jgi:hypothetical protein
VLLRRQLPESVGGYRASAIRLEDGRRRTAGRFTLEIDVLGTDGYSIDLSRRLVVELSGEEEAAEVEDEAAEREQEEGRVLNSARAVGIEEAQCGRLSAENGVNSRFEAISTLEEAAVGLRQTCERRSIEYAGPFGGEVGEDLVKDNVLMPESFTGHDRPTCETLYRDARLGSAPKAKAERIDCWKRS